MGKSGKVPEGHKRATKSKSLTVRFGYQKTKILCSLRITKLFPGEASMNMIF